MTRAKTTAVSLLIGLSGCTAIRMSGPPQARQQTPPPAIDPAQQEAARLNALPPVPVSYETHPTLDHSGRKQIGKASFYSRHFDGKKMANGDHFNPNADIAASKTLPIGTTAKVTNLRNGKTAIVKVEDRGPHVRGRVVDVSPKVARQLDMQHKGVVPVVVKPIAVPQADGSVRLGAGAADTSPTKVQWAVKTTQELTGDNSE